MARIRKSKTPSGKSAALRRKAPAKSAVHVEREDFPWTINIPEHAPRKESPAYLVARKLMNKLVKEEKNVYLGSGPYEDHHGGGLWVRDKDGWFLIKNLAGMEWSQQFCADPAKVDVLRRFAQRIYRAFPASIPGFEKLGFAGAARVLEETIDTADKVARWCDSIFNASVPLNRGRHTGVLKLKGMSAKDQASVEGGVHHYPTPITDIQLFKHDDFQLWVLDAEKQVAAVTPVGRRGSGDGRVRVAYATPGTKLNKQVESAHRMKKSVVLSDKHPMAKRAFAAQPGKKR